MEVRYHRGTGEVCGENEWRIPQLVVLNMIDNSMEPIEQNPSPKHRKRIILLAMCRIIRSIVAGGDMSMFKTEYVVSDSVDLTIAVVADLHKHDPAAVLTILSDARPDVIAVPGDLFENHEFGENLDKEDDSFISRLLCVFIHSTNRLAGLRWKQKHDVKKEHAYEFLMKASEIAPVVMSLGNHELYLTA